jgi:hypothetical protein
MTHCGDNSVGRAPNELGTNPTSPNQSHRPRRSLRCRRGLPSTSGGRSPPTLERTKHHSLRQVKCHLHRRQSPVLAHHSGSPNGPAIANRLRGMVRRQGRRATQGQLRQRAVPTPLRGLSSRQGSHPARNGRPPRRLQDSRSPGNHGRAPDTDLTSEPRRLRRAGPTPTGSAPTTSFRRAGFRRGAAGACSSTRPPSGWSISARDQMRSAKPSWRGRSSRCCADTTRSA